MAYFDTDGARGSLASDAFRADDEAGGDLRLPERAQSTLDQIADALGVTTALIEWPRPVLAGGPSACLAEASALLQAYIRIADPDLRRRCVVFVQDAAEDERRSA